MNTVASETIATSAPKFKDWARAVRLHQWSKNVLIFVPLAASHQILQLDKLTSAVIAFIAFNLCVSATYIWNDLHDLEADRAHPTKRHRPFASRRIAVNTGMWASVVLMATGLAISITLLPILATMAILAYIAATTIYSAYLKRKLMIDVVALGLLFTLRIFIGGAATGIAISPWLFAFSVFFFLSLAFVKRYTDLAQMPPGASEKLGGRGYYAQDLDLIRVMGPTSGFISALIVALYVNAPAVSGLYARPEFLWMLCPLLLYWIARVWFLAHRGEMNDDPVSFALKDRISWLTGLMVVAVVAAAAVF